MHFHVVFHDNNTMLHDIPNLNCNEIQHCLAFLFTINFVNVEMKGTTEMKLKNNAGAFLYQNCLKMNENVGKRELEQENKDNAAVPRSTVDDFNLIKLDSAKSTVRFNMLRSLIKPIK